MREILFRAKSPNDGGWIYGDYFKNTYGETFIRFWGNRTFKDFKAFPETVSQYTGLDDSNGKKIFEGDIIRASLCGDTEVYKVLWFGDKDYPAFDVLPAINVEGNGLEFIFKNSDSIEIIGNIHDNPDLLES